MTGAVDRPAAEAPAGWRVRLAAIARWEMTLSLAGLPIAMAVANRSSILFLVLAAFFALQVAAFEGRLAEAWWRLRACVTTPLGRVAGAFIAWALASAAWSHAPGATLFALGEFLLPVGAALLMAVTVRDPPSSAKFCLAAGIVIAAALVAYEFANGLALRKLHDPDALPFIYNRSILTTVIVAMPAVWWLFHVRRRLLAAVVAGAAIGSMLIGDSQAAALAVVVAVVALAAALVAPRLTASLAAAIIALSLAFAPIIGDVADDILPARVYAELQNAHSRERVEIWQAYGAAVRKAPWLGVGLGMSSRYGETDQARWLGPERQLVLQGFHPHNLAIQVWAELGAIGAILVLAVLLAALQALLARGGPALAPRLATFCAVCAVSLVAHGAWQGWWAAVVGAAAIWFVMAERAPRAPSSSRGPGARYARPHSARPVWSDVEIGSPRARSGTTEVQSAGFRR